MSIRPKGPGDLPEPLRDREGPSHSAPDGNAPLGAQRCRILPATPGRDSSSRTTPATESPPNPGFETLFQGPRAADAPAAPVLGHFAAQPCAPAESCAPRTSPVPSKSVTKPSLPARFQAWRDPERRRHDPGGCPRKTTACPRRLLYSSPGAGRPRSPRGKGPGRQLSASSPGARLCAQREKDFTA